MARCGPMISAKSSVNGSPEPNHPTSMAAVCQCFMDYSNYACVLHADAKYCECHPTSSTLVSCNNYVPFCSWLTSGSINSGPCLHCCRIDGANISKQQVRSSNSIGLLPRRVWTITTFLLRGVWRVKTGAIASRCLRSAGKKHVAGGQLTPLSH
jgi:hypothetical protein